MTKPSNLSIARVNKTSRRSTAKICISAAKMCTHLSRKFSATFYLRFLLSRCKREKTQAS